MRWVWLVVGILAALIIALFIVGAMLPSKHSVSRSITAPKTPEEVWAVVTDHAKDPEWRSDVESVRRMTDRNGHPVWEEHYKNGDSMGIETTVSEPPRKLVRKIVDQTMFSGVWTYELTPSADGKSTTVKITEDGEVYNAAFRFIGQFIIGNATTLEKYQKNLAAKLGGQMDF